MKKNNSLSKTVPRHIIEKELKRFFPNNGPLSRQYKILEVRPEEILTPSRIFDVLPKYLYAKAREEKTLTPWTTNLYLRYLVVHNKLFDGHQRASAKDFLKSFHDLLDSIKEEGFLPEKSVLPINYKMECLDGTHRTAAALVYDKKVVALQIQQQCSSLNFEELRRRGLNPEYLDQIALEYCRLNPGVRLAIIFPLVGEKYAKVEEMLAPHNICYKKEIYLTRTGIGNLIAQMYKPKEWLNAHTREIHAARRFVKGKPVRILVLNPKNNDVLIKTKEKIRKMFRHETLPIHTSDDQEETVRVAEQVFNENSIQFFNNANPTKFPHFYQLFQKYKSWIEKNNYNKEEFCIDGGAVLAAYGLRDCGDLDYIALQNIRCNAEDINSHNDFLYLHERPLKELIFDPRNYFYYDGYKFLAPHLLKKMKQRRKDVQDKKDVELISSLSLKPSPIKKLKRSISLEGIWNYIIIHLARMLWQFYRLSPKWAKPLILKMYHLIFKKIYHRIRRFLWKY